MLFQFESALSIGYKIDQMEASVAPPKLTTFALGRIRRIWPGRLTGIQSPLIMINRTDRPRSFAYPTWSTSNYIKARTVIHILTFSQYRSWAPQAQSRAGIA